MTEADTEDLLEIRADYESDAKTEYLPHDIGTLLRALDAAEARAAVAELEERDMGDLVNGLEERAMRAERELAAARAERDEAKAAFESCNRARRAAEREVDGLAHGLAHQRDAACKTQAELRAALNAYGTLSEQRGARLTLVEKVVEVTRTYVKSRDADGYGGETCGSFLLLGSIRDALKDLDAHAGER